MGKFIKIFTILAMIDSNAVAAGDAEKGLKAFKKCKSCHMIVDEGGNTIKIWPSPTALNYGFSTVIHNHMTRFTLFKSFLPFFSISRRHSI
jgi:cytochrome c